MSSAWSIGLAVFVGGALGGALRHLVSTLAASAAGGTRWPWGTLAVNVSGALVAGVVVAAGSQSPAVWSALLVAGVLGGYTTVSSVALQTVELAETCSRRDAAGYLATTLVLGAIAAIAGLQLGGG